MNYNEKIAKKIFDKVRIDIESILYQQSNQSKVVKQYRPPCIRNNTQLNMSKLRDVYIFTDKVHLDLSITLNDEIVEHLVDLLNEHYKYIDVSKFNKRFDVKYTNTTRPQIVGSVQLSGGSYLRVDLLDSK